jgi:hypothetical protein
MREHISVFVNGRPVTIPQGMKVKHALIAYDGEVYEACREGHMRVGTEDGFAVGLDGAVENGTRLQTRPAVDDNDRASASFDKATQEKD